MAQAPFVCRIVLPLAAVALAACAARLFPGLGAQEAEGPGAGSVVAAKGIRMTAYSEAWEGVPPDLQSHVTPLLVTVANESNRSVRLRYFNFRLVSDRGVSQGALLPFGKDALPARLTRRPTIRRPGIPMRRTSRRTSAARRLHPRAHFRARTWCAGRPEGVLQPGTRERLSLLRVLGGVRTPAAAPWDFDDAQTGKRAVRLVIPFLHRIL